MAFTGYISLALGLERAIERCQAEDDDAETYLTELLELSAGTAPSGTIGVPGVKHYRPWYVAARYLAQNPDLRDLSVAVGEAEFTLAQPRIDDLLSSQAAYDLAFALTVPPGMSASYSPVASARRPCATTSVGSEVIL